MPKSRSNQVIERIFEEIYVSGETNLPIERSVFAEIASNLDLATYSDLDELFDPYRTGRELPEEISSTAPEGYEWVIECGETGLFAFSLIRSLRLFPNDIELVSIPDVTPLPVAQYASSDLQAMLARIRYNRLVDLLSGVISFYHLSDPREIGQSETDDLYVGFDRQGNHCILPVVAIGLSEKVSRSLIENAFATCRVHFPALVAKPIGAIRTDVNTIALFEFGYVKSELVIKNKRHYDLHIA